MEIKRKQKTLVGLFLKFALLFCINTVLIIIGCAVLLISSTYIGITLPSNYSEMQLTEHMAEIQSAKENIEDFLPTDSTYGIYDAEGNWKSGTLSEKEQITAWTQYQNANTYASPGKYYRFIKQNDGDICIIKYGLLMKYSSELLNDILPSPEILSFILDAVLFLLNAFLLSRYFAKKLKQQLKELRSITDKIAQNDLEFEAKSSDIREINEVMTSLSQMKDALKDSLNTQWEMEQQKKEQLSALAHDIKTPLTIIHGNAELLAEESLSDENRECTEYILSNAADIEKYLRHMNQVLNGTAPGQDKERMSCIQLGELFRNTAAQLAAAEQLPVAFDIDIPDSTLSCCRTNLLRAWNNLLSNATEHTNHAKGIEVSIVQNHREGTGYLKASVRDFGKGFTPKDLKYADKEFYSGDTSRHDRNHQGLGLSIARGFLEQQGGFMEYGNHPDGGAVVTLWIKTEKNG